MKKVLLQEDKVFRVVRDSVQRNAFFAFPDNILGCMLADSQKSVREKALNTIKEIRLNKPKKFDLDRTVPTLEWNAEDYSSMIDWESVSWAQLNEPSMTQKMSIEQLESVVESPMQLDNLYCHTQCVERAVKLVSASATHVFSKNDRHSSILVGLDSRNKRKKIDNKNSYKGAHELFFSMFCFQLSYVFGQLLQI